MHLGSRKTLKRGSREFCESARINPISSERWSSPECWNRLGAIRLIRVIRVPDSAWLVGAHLRCSCAPQVPQFLKRGITRSFANQRGSTLLFKGPVAAAENEVQVESLRPIPRYSAPPKLRGWSKRHSAHGLTDSLNLVQVKEVVTGVQLEMVRETFLASLYVNTDALQIFRLGSAYQPEVRLSKD